MYQSDLSIHAKVKHITGADPGGENWGPIMVEVVYNKHTAIMMQVLLTQNW